MAKTVSSSDDLKKQSTKIQPGVAPLRAGQGHDFLMRRLHSLSGIFPVGAFLFEHIVVSNGTAINGPTAYYHTVKFLTSMPFLVALELFGIWLPILFHAVYGFHIWRRGQSNLASYPWEGNWMYTMQRWTGGIAFFYIVWHTYTMRFSGVHLLTHPAAAFGKVQMELANPVYLAFYIVGLVAASWHFAYGIWLFAAKWGITVGERARQRFLPVCMGLFLLLVVVGGFSLRSFKSYPMQPIAGPGLELIEQGK